MEKSIVVVVVLVLIGLIFRPFKFLRRDPGTYGGHNSAGYQPTEGNIDINNPPQEGSGLPSGMPTDQQPDPVTSVIEAPGVDMVDMLEYQVWLCGQCVFYKRFKPEPVRVRGECRRKSPEPGAEISPYRSIPGAEEREPGKIYILEKSAGRFPIMKETDWCGESSPSDEHLAAMRGVCSGKTK